MELQKLLESVKNISVPKPDDYSGRELFYSIQEMNHAINNLRDLALAQQKMIEDLQQKVASKL